MIVTVTPTIGDGTVVRWHADNTPLDELRHWKPLVSASRRGVLVGLYLHQVPEGVMASAQEVFETLRRDHDADMHHLATHRQRGMFGPYEPIPAGQEATG